MKNKLLEIFDELKHNITTSQGKETAKELRRMLVRSEKYCAKLDRYFSLTLDGVEPEDAKEQLGL